MPEPRCATMMTMQLLVLGTNHRLSYAELTSLYGEVKNHNREVAVVVPEASVEFDRLGGSRMVADHVATLDLVEPAAIMAELTERFAELTDLSPDASKITLGVNFYGTKLNGKAAQKLLLDAKKALKRQGYSIRMLLPKGAPNLNTAQITHNHLLEPGSAMLVCSFGKTDTHIGKVTDIQDIESYTQRDRGRPCRDAKVGMLPPKLAQVMINLAKPAYGSTVVDPFCGSGVVLQEALLMGFNAAGSDLSERMVDCSHTNLEWLRTQRPGVGEWSVEHADATALTTLPDGYGAIVTEGFLGPTLSHPPSGTQVDQLQKEAAELYAAFLRNLHPLLTSATPLCIAIPAWRTKNGVIAPTVVDQIESLGYNHSKLRGVSGSDLLYIRPQSIVGRQLVVLEKA